jgi:hypothetical protein
MAQTMSDLPSKGTGQEQERADESTALSLPNGQAVELSRTDQGARVTLRGASGTSLLQLEIALTSDGPVIRAGAAALELNVERALVARCDSFRVEATRKIELVSREDVAIESGKDMEIAAVTGGVRLHANDDVQVLGEQILLNTERQPPAPAWVRRIEPTTTQQTVPASDASGDATLIADVK